MAGKELYNVDIQINVNGVDEGTAKLKKMDKELSELEKKAKRPIKPRVDMSGMSKTFQKMTGMSKKFQKMTGQTNSAFYNYVTGMSTMTKKMAGQSNSSFYAMAKGADSATRRINDSIKRTENMIKHSSVSTKKMLEGQAKMFKQNSIFRNSTMDLMMGKASMIGGVPIKITATENVTQTIAKTRASLQNLKAMGNVKATLKASDKQARDAINRTRAKAKEYASGKYEAILTARDKLSGTVFGRMHSAVGGAIRRAGRLVSIGASAVGGIGLTSMIKTFSDYSSQMSKLKAVTDMTAREFKMLDRQAQNLGKSTEWSASQVAQGMTELGQAGFASKEIYQAMPGLLNLASAGGLQLAEASGIASGTLRAFNLEAGKTGHVANVLAKTASATNSEVNEIGNSMEYAAPYAKMLNVSLEDTAAAIGMLSQVNIKGSKAGMGLRGMFTSLMAPTAGAKKVMDKFGFSAFDATGKMKPFPQVIQELDRSLSKLNPQQKGEAINKMFGDVAGGSIQALLNLGPDKLAKLTKELEYSQGAAEKMAKTRLDNLKGDFTILKSAVEGMLISLGKKLEPHLRQFVQWLTNKIPEIEKALGKAIDFIANNWDTIIGGLKTAIPLILGLHTAISGLSAIASFANIVKDIGILKEALGGIVGASSGAGGAIAGLKGALAGIGGSVAGILAVAGAFAYLCIKVSDSNAKIMDMQKNLKNVGKPLAQIMEFIGGIGKALMAGNRFMSKIRISALKADGKGFVQAFSDFSKDLSDAETSFNMSKSYAGDKIINSTSKDMKKVNDVYRAAIGERKNIVAGNYDVVSDVMSKKLKGISTKELDILKGTNSDMAYLLRGITKNSDLGSIKEKLKQNFNDLYRTSEFDPNKLNDGFKKSMGEINKYLSDSAPSLKSSFSDIFNNFKNNAKTSGVRDSVQSMIKDIQSAGPAIQSAISSNKTAMEGMFKGIDFKSMGFEEQVNQVMKNIGNMNPAQATQAFRSLFSQLGTAATEGGKQIGQNATKGIENSVASGGANGAGMIEKMFAGSTEAATAKGHADGNAYTSAVESSIKLANQTNTASGNENTHVQKANQMATGVKQAYTNMYNGASNSVAQLASRTRSTFSALSASATGQVNAMCSRIIAAWNAMKAVVSATVTAHFVLSVSTVGGMGAVPHADGGILTEPHIGLVAEAGPEAVIPLSPGKRARGLELFKQAGEMLGIKQSSDGNANNGLAQGIADKNFGNNQEVRPSGQGEGNNNNVNVNVNVNAGGTMDKNAIIDEAVEVVRQELEDALDNLA